MKAFSLNIRGELKEFHQPAVMSIVNLTEDSFFAPSRVQADAVVDRVGKMVEAGAEIIDLGACSTRPGSTPPAPEVESERLCAAISAIRSAFGSQLLLSVDTYRASVARNAVEAGADIINDIGGGTLDGEMFATVAELRVPYILMHLRGTPETMQQLTDYDDVVADVIADLSRKLRALSDAGVADVIVDPGFGFAKTVEQNYRMLEHLEAFEVLGKPILVGVSHKSMLRRVVGEDYQSTLAATTAVNMAAMERGAAILRVHDTAAAVAAVKVYNMLSNS